MLEQLNRACEFTNSFLLAVVAPHMSKWTGKVDSRGFRILKDQILDIQNLPEYAVVQIIQNSVIYHDGT